MLTPPRSRPLVRLCLVLTVAALAACSKAESYTEPVRPAVTQKVKLEAGLGRTVYTGEVKARYEVDVGFRTPGKIVSRKVDVGARVDAGTVLAELDPADARLNADAARAQVAAAQTDVEFARGEEKRYRELLVRNFVGQSVYDGKKSTLEAARAQLDQARSQLSVALNQTRYTTLTVDHPGVVTNVRAEVGQVVGVGQPVFRVARTQEIEVLVNVPESRISEWRQGADCVVKLWADRGRTYRARVREVAPNADPATRTYDVRASLLDPDATVRLGMTAGVALADAEQRAALLPLSAIYSRDGKPGVWVVEPKSHKATLRAVTVGAYLESGVTVTSGLSDGDLVIVSGVHRISPGQTVRPVDAQANEQPS
jgi:membrane fusion protein, multidrug efflux system